MAGQGQSLYAGSGPLQAVAHAVPGGRVGRGFDPDFLHALGVQVAQHGKQLLRGRGRVFGHGLLVHGGRGGQGAAGVERNGRGSVGRQRLQCSLQGRCIQQAHRGPGPNSLCTCAAVVGLTRPNWLALGAARPRTAVG